MTDAEIILKLRQLKRLGPSQDTLAVLASRIKEKRLGAVYSPSENFFRFLKNLHMLPILAIALATVFVLIIAAAGPGTLVGRSQIAFTKIRLALASNRYQKARLALNLSQNQLNSLKSGQQKNLGRQMALLSNSLDQTDASLRSLRLEGEAGKYTKQQCLQAYQTYGEYLDNLNDALKESLATAGDESTQIKIQSLLNKSSQYEQGVYAKLKMY